MFSATSLLVLACAFAVALSQNPQPDKCTSAQIGTLDGYPVDLITALLPEYYQDDKVNIPTVPECIYGVSGVYATVCDYDVRPDAWFIDFNTVWVHRRGSAQGQGTVKVIVYCKAY